MEVKKFLRIFFEGAKSLLQKPTLTIAGVVFWAILWGISWAGKVLSPSFQTTWANVAWTIAIGSVSFTLGAYILGGMIGLLKKRRKNVKNSFIKNANSFWLRSLLILVFILIVSLIIGRIAHYGAFYIGKAANLETVKAMVVFVLIYFAGLVGALAFLTYSNFILVLNNLKVYASIRASVALAKKEYLATISLNVIFFLLFLFANLIPGILGDILLFGLLLPYFVAVLTKFVEMTEQ